MDKLKQYIQDNREKLDADSPMEGFWDTIGNQLAQGDNDHLKDHISSNISDLDIETPAIAAWDRIEDVLSRKPARVVTIKKTWLYAAACCLVILGLGIVFYVNKPGQDIVKVPVMPINTGIKPVARDTIKKDMAITPPVKKQAIEETFDTVKKDIATLSSPNGTKLSKRTRPRNESSQVVKDKSSQLPAEVLQIQTGYNDLIAGQVSYIQHLPIYGENVRYFESFVYDFKRLDMQEKELRRTIMQKGLQENSLDELGMIYQEKLMILKRLQTEINKTSRSRNETDTIPRYIRL
jgi:hypothetical protein